jgi:putative PIN family toxin of toxin-antitoxin system
VKVVPDTMIWVSYCTMKSGYRHALIERARRKRVRIYVSHYILDELAETLVEDLKCTRRYASLACRAVQRIAKLVDLPQDFPRHVPGDPDDDPIVQTALSGKVHFLVTADKEILRLGKLRDVEILTAQEFEERLDQEL